MIDRGLCALRFESFPPWPCPECDRGVLRLDDKATLFASTAGVAAGIDAGYLEPFDNHGTFAARMTCASEGCAQGVIVLGDFTNYLEDYEDLEIGTRYVVRDIYPAPKLVLLPVNVPEIISNTLKRSFGLFWRDAQACAGVIRSAIEEIASHLGQPAEGPNGRFVVLAKRLENLATEHPDLSEAARAIKDLGNEGVHGDDVGRDNLLNAYELLEIELRRLFNDDEERRGRLLQQLRAPRRPPAPPRADE